MKGGKIMKTALMLSIPAALCLAGCGDSSSSDSGDAGTGITEAMTGSTEAASLSATEGAEAAQSSTAALPLLNDEELFTFSTDLSNENPYHGLYRQDVDVDDSQRELVVYLPEGLRRNEYFVTLALPEDVDAADYLEKSGWIDIADNNHVGLRVLLPAADGWGSYEEETPYIQAALNAGGNCFSGFYYMTFGFEYLYGAGTGGSLLEQWAAENPMQVIAQAYVDVDLDSETLSQLTENISFGDDLSMPAHEDSKVAAVYTDVPADEIPVPTWLSGSDASADYWTAVNGCSSETSEGDYATAPAIYVQDKESAFRIATSYTDIASEVLISDQEDYADPALVSDVYSFMSRFTRTGNDSVHSNTLLERPDYSSLKEEGRLFEVSDFIQTVDNSGNEDATTDTTDWKRNYIVYIPEQCTDYKEVSYPVVYMFPGGADPSHSYLDASSAWQVADKYGYILVVPSSVNGWNIQDGSWPVTQDPVTGSIVNDFDFVDRLFDEIEKDYNTDPGRVYVTGFSMGGIFANYLGMQLGDRITALGITSGPIFGAEEYNDDYSVGTGLTYAENATTGTLPAMFIFGEADNWPIMVGPWTDTSAEHWYAGRMNTYMESRYNDEYYSYETQHYWLTRNGLDEENGVMTEQGLTADGQDVTSTAYTADTQAQRYTTTTWSNDDDIPLVSWTACAGRSHNPCVSDYEKIWTEWFSHYRINESGTLLYSADGFDTGTQIR